MTTVRNRRLQAHAVGLIAAASLSFGTAHAAPAPQPTVASPVSMLNDGYVIVEHLDTRHFALSDKVCPMGSSSDLTGIFETHRACMHEQQEVPMVSVQSVIDTVYGAERAQAVGYSPGRYDYETVVYVKMLTH